MFSSVPSVLKGFIYSIAALLLVCSVSASFCFIFEGQLPGIPLKGIGDGLTYVSTVLITLQVILMPLVTIFQIARLRNYFWYFVLSLVACIAYISLWFDITHLFGIFGINF